MSEKQGVGSSILPLATVNSYIKNFIRYIIKPQHFIRTIKFNLSNPIYKVDENEINLLKNKLEDEILFFEKAKLQIVENLKNFKIKN